MVGREAQLATMPSRPGLGKRVMKRIRYRISAILVMAATAVGISATAAPRQSLGAGAANANGVSSNPLDVVQRITKPSVLLFTTVDCPIANAYAPEIERIYEKYGPKGIRFYLVYTDATLKRKAVNKHLKEFSLKLPAVLDPGHKVVHRCGATITPEVAILMPNGAIAYRGRIDNRNVGFGNARYKATTHELRDALDVVCSGHPENIKTAVTKAVGCYIAPPL